MLAVIMAIIDEDDRLFVETVFNKYSKKMYLIAVNILNNHEDAEDCVQDTIVKIINQLDNFRKAEQEEYLIKLIVITCRNTALNKYKSNREKGIEQFSTTVYDEDEESSVMDIPDASSDVEKLVMSDYTCRCLTEIIDSLDYKYRDILVLKGMSYDYDDIARIMNISQVLVRKRYSRARKMILKKGGAALYEHRN